MLFPGVSGGLARVVVRLGSTDEGNAVVDFLELQEEFVEVLVGPAAKVAAVAAQDRRHLGVVLFEEGVHVVGTLARRRSRLRAGRRRDHERPKSPRGPASPLIGPSRRRTKRMFPAGLLATRATSGCAPTPAPGAVHDIPTA